MELEMIMPQQNNQTQPIEQEIETNLEKTNNIEKEQNNFLDSTLGKIVNTGLDLGIRFLFPDFIENELIDVKNTMLRSGFKEGIDQAIESAINLGKSALGIVTGKFDSVSQAHTAIKRGGILDTVSDTIDNVLQTSKKNGLMNKSTFNILKKGKKAIVDNIANNIEETFAGQIKSVEKLGKYADNWSNAYQQQNFEEMEKEYQKIKQEVKQVLPLENTLKQVRQIENLHNLIKNNGKNFNLSEEQLELTQRLIS